MIATASTLAPRLPAEIWEVSDDEYFADSANSLSNSEATCFMESPPLYYGRHILKLPDYQREPTDALEFGKTFEDMLYPPEGGGPLMIPREVLSANGARAGNTWKQFRDENAGRRLILPDEKRQLDAMIESVKKHHWARKLLIEINGKRQVAIRFSCPLTGIRRRAKLDHKFKSAIVDLKTTRDAGYQQFSKDALEYGYHRQADWYRTAVHALTGDWLPFLFVVVRKTAPYTVRVFELEQQFATLGELQNADNLQRFARCQETGIWEEDGHGDIITLPAPPWAIKEKHWVLT